MSKELEIESCICALKKAKIHAVAGGFIWCFCSAIDRLIETAGYNRDTADDSEDV